jgi:Uma2 family endonuclease
MLFSTLTFYLIHAFTHSRITLSPMATKTKPYPQQDFCEKFLLSVDDYHRMGEIGIFDDKPRVELIDGDILVRSPITPYHTSHVDKVGQFFILKLGEKVNVRSQGSVRLDKFSEPEPDIALLRRKENYYQDAHPAPEDIHLLIEVAVETVKKDRTLKLEKYARSGIPEYWIIIPKEGIIEVYRKPEGETYLEKSTFRKADEWRYEAFDLQVKGSDFLI